MHMRAKYRFGLTCFLVFTVVLTVPCFFLYFHLIYGFILLTLGTTSIIGLLFKKKNNVEIMIMSFFLAMLVAEAVAVLLYMKNFSS